MGEDRLTQRLMQTFLGELDDHVRDLGRDLLQLEAAAGEERQAELVRGLFRTAHSFKGAARSLELDLIEAAKADATLRSIPVLAVTAYAGKGDEERIRQAGAEAYLAKPVSIGPFMNAVRGLVRVQ